MSLVLQPRWRLVALAVMCSSHRSLFVAVPFQRPGGSFAGLTDDHFFYLVRGWQILFGDLPVRDFVDHGAPLFYYIGAAVQVLFGRGTLSELVFCTTALAVGAAATFWLSSAPRARSGWARRDVCSRLARAALLQLPEDPGLRRGDSAAVVVCRQAGCPSARMARRRDGDRRFCSVTIMVCSSRSR